MNKVSSAICVLWALPAAQGAQAGGISDVGANACRGETCWNGVRKGRRT
jgi:hypothetical protein